MRKVTKLLFASSLTGMGVLTAVSIVKSISLKKRIEELERYIDAADIAFLELKSNTEKILDILSQKDKESAKSDWSIELDDENQTKRIILDERNQIKKG